MDKSLKCFSAVKRAKLRRSRLGARECLLLSVFSFCFFENKQWSKMIVRPCLARSLARCLLLSVFLSRSFILSVCLSVSLSLSLSLLRSRSLAVSFALFSVSLSHSLILSVFLSVSLARSLSFSYSVSLSHSRFSIALLLRSPHAASPALQMPAATAAEACTRRRHPGGGPVLCFAAAREMGVPVVPGTHMHFDYSA